MAPFFWFTLFSTLTVLSSTATDTLEPTQQIKDGEFIVSPREHFKLGFFSPGKSKNRYVGIWFNKISVVTPVWVANRQIPLTNSSGVLTITNQGITLVNNQTVIWSSFNSTRSFGEGNLVAQLLDSGNLVLRMRNEEDPQKYVWQSFDHPVDTLIAGMKLGRNNVTGVQRQLSSWTSTNDPATGKYTFEVDPRGFPQLVGRKDSVQIYCSGPWNGLRFSGTPNLKPNPYYDYEFIFNQEEAYYTYKLKDIDLITRLVINSHGDVQRFMWNDRNQEWGIYLKIQIDICDEYDSCGAYGTCKVDNSPRCGCLEKFVPRNHNEWDKADWSNGCVRRKALDCKKGDSFKIYKDVKLPDTRNSWYAKNMTLEDCKMVCLRNCSCVAYSRLDVSTRSGCLLWFGELIDIREYPENGQEIYIRLASSEVGFNNKNQIIRYTATILVVVLGMLILGLCVTLHIRKKKKKKKKQQQKLLREELLKHTEKSEEESDTNTESHKEIEVPLINYSYKIANATYSQTLLEFQDIGTGGEGKKCSNEVSSLRPKKEEIPPMPPLKVRKEKLGDKITALQQLVSPFGKTDTASVLFEAIEYIKFLHDQVNVLSSPYLNSGTTTPHHQKVAEKSKDPEAPKQGLKSRGLCLVPISSTLKAEDHV